MSSQKKPNFLSSPKLQKATRITCSIFFSPEILKKSPVSTLDIRVLLKDPSMEDAQRLRLLGFGSELPQAPGVLVGRVLASLACSWPTFCLMDLKEIVDLPGKWWYISKNQCDIICFNIQGSQKMFQILTTTGSYCFMSITQELGPSKKITDCVLNR